MKSLMMYHPLDSVRTLVDIDRLIDSFFGNPEERRAGLCAKFPTVDICETKDAYLFEAALPGFEEKDIEVNIDGNTLTIESKKSNIPEKPARKDGAEAGTNETNGGNYILRERHFESFSRSFKLPENADSGEVTAEFKNGLLSLNIKKRSEAQRRVIAINSKLKQIDS